jgi:hypothetical protein
MAVAFDDNDKEDATTADSTMTDTAASLNLPHTATKSGNKTHEMKEIDVRYEIPVQVGNSIEDHIKLHIQVLHALSSAFDHINLHVLDKQQQQVSNFDNPRWLEIDYYDRHFQRHVDVGQRMSVIEHSIVTTHTLLNIQEDIAIAAFLQSTNTSLCDPHTGFPYQMPIKNTPEYANNTDPRDKNTTETEPTLNAATEEDNHSQATVPSGRIPENNEPELVEIFLRVEITPNKRDDRGPNLCHAAVLKEMYNSFPEHELQIINNRNKRIQPHNYQKWSKSAYYQRHFDTHTLAGKGGKPDRHFVVHRIRTTLSLSIIRHDRKVFQALQENNVFLRRHFFQEDEWDTITLGFILFMDPSKHMREEATERVLQTALKEDCYKKGPGDKFQLVAGSPFLYVAGRRYPTQAYTVVCLRDHAGEVDELLKNTYRKTSHYVKFRLRTKNAQAFGKALQAQNQYLASLRTIPIVGIPTEMMYDLEAKILEVEGVTDVLRSNKTETIGRWNIITYDDIFKSALKTIKNSLSTWEHEVCRDEYEYPANFPDIAVTARVADDDSSVGDCSYMSTSAISYGSFLTTDSNDHSHNGTQDYQRPASYAAAATNRQTNRPATSTFVPVHQSSVSAMSSPATIPMDVQQKIRVMEDKISHFQDLEEKVERLTKILEALLGTQSTSNTPTADNPTPERHHPRQLPSSPPAPTTTAPKHPLPPPPPPPPPPPRAAPPTNTITDGSLKSPPRVDNTAIRLFTGSNIDGAKDIVFDDWKLVEKKGKRNAETANIGAPKRLTQRDTPTRIKAIKGTSAQKKDQSRQPAPPNVSAHQIIIPADTPPPPDHARKPAYLTNRDNNDAARSSRLRVAGPVQGLPPSSTQIVNVTIKDDTANKKPAGQAAIRATRPQTWQQRLNFVPTKKVDDTPMDGPFTQPEEDQPMDITPSPVEAHSGTTSHPAADARPSGV